MYLLWVNTCLAYCIRCESASRNFLPGEGSSRGLLCDCTTGYGTDGSICGTNHYPATQGQPLKRHKSGDEVTETITAVMNDPVVVQLIEFQIVNCVRLCAAGPGLAIITQH